MQKFNLKLAATVMICGAFLFSSCIGSFGLHTKLRQWNEGISNKFVNELVFLAFNIIPVYGVCYLADALVINSIEFWSGSRREEKRLIDTLTVLINHQFTIFFTKGLELRLGQ